MTNETYELGLEGIEVKPGKTTADEMALHLIRALRSGKLEYHHLIELSEMLSPKGTTPFRLIVKRRPTHRHQWRKEQDERSNEIERIYARTGRNEKETIAIAQQDQEDGGMGISERTARKYLRRMIEYNAAMDELRAPADGISERQVPKGG